MTDKFDYVYMGICQYDDVCGLPAVARGWWVSDDGKDSEDIYLCLHHLEFILENDKT